MQMRIVAYGFQFTGGCVVSPWFTYQIIIKRVTYEAIKEPRAIPRPVGMMRLASICSFAEGGPIGGARAFETASLSFKLNISRYDPS